MMTRPAFGGNLMATIVCEDFRPQMATVRPGVMPSIEVEKTDGEVIEDKFEFSHKEPVVHLKEVLKIENAKKDITEANIRRSRYGRTGRFRRIKRSCKRT